MNQDTPLEKQAEKGEINVNIITIAINASNRFGVGSRGGDGEINIAD